MEEQLKRLEENSVLEISNAQNKQELYDLKVKYLGKKGELTNILKGMKDLSKEERPVIGALANKVRDNLEKIFSKKDLELEKKELQKKLEEEKIDVTLPSKKQIRGSKHPLNRVIEEIEDLFVSMGYDVVDGPELETDEFCFERLNLPKGHPARDMQDSFYITKENLLRTQTSAVQARTMLEKAGKEPIRII